MPSAGTGRRPLAVRRVLGKAANPALPGGGRAREAAAAAVLPQHSQSRNSAITLLTGCTVLRTVVLSSPRFTGMHPGFPIHELGVPLVSVFHARPICTALSANLLVQCCDRWSDKQRAAHSGTSRMILMLRSHVKFLDKCRVNWGHRLCTKG